MTVEKLITDHIDIWSSALQTRSTAGRGNKGKIDLYGIKKLRELILELAVRGKLVPQDPNDEPASELLKRIAVEKAELIKQGKIKKQKPLPEISEDEKPFELPMGWEWVRLGTIANIFNGNSISSTDKEKKYSDCDGMPFIATKDIGYGFEEPDYDNGISIPYGTAKFKVAAKGSVLICAEGGSAGKKCGVTQQDICFGNKLFANECYSEIEAVYLLSNFLSPSFFSRFESSMTGIIGGISSSKFNNLIIPLSPNSEQKRIICKVDELMSLCDQLEQQSLTSLDAHSQLVDTLLTTLTDSRNSEELTENWARISQHFDTLFTTEASIDALKQTILQLAVMGKLVPQNPNDEPASQLLKRIEQEKSQLVKDGKIKKQKPLPPISDEEKLFELPVGWEWCRLDDICSGITSGSTPSKDIFSLVEGIPYLKVYNIRNQKIDFEYKPQFIQEQYNNEKMKRSTLYPGDIVMNIVGPPLGKIAVIPNTYPRWNCNQAIVFFRSIEDGIGEYIYLYLLAGMFLDSIELIGTAGQDNISVTKSRSIVLPLPPKNEQAKINNAINDMLFLCDALKSRLHSTQQTQLYLADALTDAALD